MFCYDCDNETHFHTSNTEVTCMNCGLVVIDQIFEDKYTSFDNDLYFNSNDITELLCKYGLAESHEEVITPIMKRVKGEFKYKGDNLEYATHAAISIVCKVENKGMFPSAKYSNIYNKVFYLINPTAKKKQIMRKEWASDMILFNNLISHNIEVFECKTLRRKAYNIYDDMPYSFTLLNSVKEKNIFLVIIFIALGNIKVAEFAKNNDISTTSILKIKKYFA
jgi:hypothetical protein